MPSKLVLATSIPLVPLTCTALYLAYLNYRISRKGIHSRTTPHLQTRSLDPYLPTTIRTNQNDFVLHHEVVHASVPVSALSSSSSLSRRDPDTEIEDHEASPGNHSLDTEAILTSFLRTTMTSFTSLPPAYAIRHALKSCPPSILNTFSVPYLRALTFQPGDRVCGVYVVISRSHGRAVLNLDAPEGYVGPVIEGILVVEVDVDRVDGTDGVVYITDHTLLWREKGKGAPNVLESAVGRWVHAGMVRWMVEKGVEGVVEQWKGGKGM